MLKVIIKSKISSYFWVLSEQKRKIDFILGPEKVVLEKVYSLMKILI